jgi:hypothetical protein
MFSLQILIVVNNKTYVLLHVRTYGAWRCTEKKKFVGLLSSVDVQSG